MAHCAVVIGTAAYFIANAGEREASWLAEVAATYSECEIARAAQREIDALMDNGATPEQVRDACTYLDFLYKREVRGLRNVFRLTWGEEAQELKGRVNMLRMYLSRVRDFRKIFLRWAVGVEPAPPAPLSDREQQMAEIVPRNLLYSDPRHLVRLPADQRPASAGTLGSLLEWFDGKRTLLDCVRSYALTFRRPGEAIKTLDEIGKMLHPDLGLWDYLNLLREYGYVAW
jgi:hypothetical protein